jgi:hypothetical protein
LDPSGSTTQNAIHGVSSGRFEIVKVIFGASAKPKLDRLVARPALLAGRGRSAFSGCKGGASSATGASADIMRSGGRVLIHLGA